MKRLSSQIQKRFGQGIKYKHRYFDSIIINDNYVNIFQRGESDGVSIKLSINDIMSVELGFLESLNISEFYNVLLKITYEKGGSRTQFGIPSLDLHRLYLAKIDDEDKILYILNHIENEI